MMSMPFTILGTFGSMAWFSVRRARAAQQSAVPAVAAGGTAF